MVLSRRQGERTTSNGVRQYGFDDDFCEALASRFNYWDYFVLLEQQQAGRVIKEEERRSNKQRETYTRRSLI